MSFELDPEVAATLEAMAEQSGPLPPPPPVGDIEGRRSALNAMLAWANNVAQPIADEVETTEYQLTVADGTTNLARWYRLPSSDWTAPRRTQKYRPGAGVGGHRPVGILGRLRRTFGDTCEEASTLIPLRRACLVGMLGVFNVQVV